MSKMLHLSETFAGVTLLALGNGAPDFSSAIFSPDQDSEMMYAEILGGSMFMIGVIAGLIAIVSPFHVIAEHFVRDAIFLVISIVMIQWAIDDDHYSVGESIGTLGIYIVYLTVVIIEYVIQRRKRMSE